MTPLVLREKGTISAQTIDKVRTTIAELGYVHNVAAANLRANTSCLIGLILHDFSDTFTLKVTSSIVQGLAERGYMVFVGQPADQEDPLAECLLPFIRQGVAGVIYLTSNTRPKRLPNAISTGPLPLVTVAQIPFDNILDLVIRDNRQASVLATRFLMERGHRNIAYIGGEAGRQAVEAILAKIKQPQLAGQHITLSGEIIARKSG